MRIQRQRTSVLYRQDPPHKRCWNLPSFDSLFSSAFLNQICLNMKLNNKRDPLMLKMICCSDCFVQKTLSITHIFQTYKKRNSTEKIVTTADKKFIEINDTAAIKKESLYKFVVFMSLCLFLTEKAHTEFGHAGFHKIT